MKIQVDTKSFSNMLDKAQKEINKVTIEAYKHFKDITPKRSGNARSKTRLVNDTITADYAYAGKLDEGSSTQAPDGMSAPTEEFIDKKLIPQAVRRINDGQ